MLAKNESKNNNSKLGNDSPILDLNNSAIKSLIKKGKLNGFVTLDELNQALPPGEYTNINGNIGLSWGLIAAAKKANLDLFYGSYPITPASDILHELSKHKNFNVITFQAEDEIAAAAASVGASFTGKLAVTGTSGPGLALKSETMPLLKVRFVLLKDLLEHLLLLSLLLRLQQLHS